MFLFRNCALLYEHSCRILHISTCLSPTYAVLLLLSTVWDVRSTVVLVTLLVGFWMPSTHPLKPSMSWRMKRFALASKCIPPGLPSHNYVRQCFLLAFCVPSVRFFRFHKKQTIIHHFVVDDDVSPQPLLPPYTHTMSSIPSIFPTLALHTSSAVTTLTHLVVLHNDLIICIMLLPPPPSLMVLIQT